MVNNKEYIKSLFEKAKVIIFDLDGTITNTKKIYEKAWMGLTPKHGLEPSKDFVLDVCGSSKENAYPIIKNIIQTLIQMFIEMTLWQPYQKLRNITSLLNQARKKS